MWRGRLPNESKTMNDSPDTAQRPAQPDVATGPLFGVWYPVEKRLPEGDEVLCWDGEMVSTYFPESLGDHTTVSQRAACLGITHWMPMPLPPNKPSDDLPRSGQV